MFCTVLHHLKSPENVGILFRAHVAFGGEEIVILGPEPWQPKKRAQAFSRKLERLCDFVRLDTDEEFFDWCRRREVAPVAIEIASPPTMMPEFEFPERSALVVGHEGRGLPDDFLARCHATVTIPQHGPVACLNAAVSGCIAMYEITKQRPVDRVIDGHRYFVEESLRQRV